jgi:hypothetical protein
VLLLGLFVAYYMRKVDKLKRYCHCWPSILHVLFSDSEVEEGAVLVSSDFKLPVYYFNLGLNRLRKWQARTKNFG